ncbi:protein DETOXIFICATION 16-like isoform X3 [Quercus robur]|uniref:protein DETOXIFICATION 16-like isoform X3 n=1 Tax=Quercus robur TaxID=38942 RepID=UPI0021613750|nr:protein DETOXIFICATION 16-like isoform X3 [Quercus robur]
MAKEVENMSLNSPLIQISKENGLSYDRERSSEKISQRNEFFVEMKKQLWLAGPLITVNLLLYFLQVISLMFVGHLGELALSGAAMATSFASVSGFSILYGMSSALDTLCGQSNGAKKHHMLGIHMQGAVFVVLLVSIPLAIILENTGTILIKLGQDPEISEAAGIYASCMIPVLFAYGILQCLVRFLQTQNIVFPMMLCSGITTILHFLVCWILVFKSSLGYRGAAFAISISYWINAVLLALYIKFSSSCTKTWKGFSKDALHNIPTFVKLAIPSAIMVCMATWSFEMVVLLSGFLPNPKLETSVLSISLNTIAIVWMIPYGFSGVVSTRVSNELGAGNAEGACLAVRVVFVIATIEGMVVGLVMILIRNIWGYAYSNEVEVVRHVANIMPILATSNFLDGLQGVLSGTARGCGWQNIGACVNFGSYYLVGIPSAILLAFIFKLGGKGLWFGIICALIVQLSSLLIITMRTNWKHEAKKATERVHGSAIHPEAVLS